MTQSTHNCSICDTLTKPFGQVWHPSSPKVAGVDIDLKGINFTLQKCPNCGLICKWPPISEDKLMQCYAKAGSNHWGEEVDPHERRFDTIKDIVERYSHGKRILDIGCFNGALLDYFGPTWERFGVEPGEAAARRAQDRGLTIIGGTLDDLQGHAAQFDVVLAIDVIEHLCRPQQFFADAAKLLKVNGILVAVTGDTDSLPWRLHGSSYWYASLVEHVVFWNRSSLAQVASRSGLQLVACLRHPHSRPRVAERLVDLTKNSVYFLGQLATRCGIVFSSRIQRRASPSTKSSSDHLYAVLQKK